jgi:hypothetical protein
MLVRARIYCKSLQWPETAVAQYSQDVLRTGQPSDTQL